jgi:uncharacterized membrane protein YfcA
MEPFNWLVGVASFAAGAIASVTGFGIGSILTPVLSVRIGVKLAVAAVAIPHVVATAQRFWTLRSHVDRRVLWGFGVASAIGGLAGAYVHTRTSTDALGLVFGIGVTLTGIAELTGWMRRVRWGRRAAWVAGTLSGALGGLVGNQGSIRTAALLGFEIPQQSFVATATAIALFVDGARVPVYLATEWRALATIWPLVLLMTITGVIGTALGTRMLGKIPQHVFRRIVAVFLIAIGGYTILVSR